MGTATEELLSPEEVGERLGVSVYTVRRWIKEGKLRAFKPGKEYRVRVADLEEFFAAREVRPKAEGRSSLEPTFNDVLAEERHPSPAFVEAILSAVDRWISTVSAPETKPSKITGLVEAALDVGELVDNVGDEVSWESLPYEQQRAILRVMEKTNEVARRGLRRLQEDNEAAEFKRRREKIRERTREISRRSASA